VHLLTLSAWYAEQGQTIGNGRVSVRPSVRPAATAAGGFAAERWRLQQISIDASGRRAAGAHAQHHMRAASC